MCLLGLPRRLVSRHVTESGAHLWQDDALIMSSLYGSIAIVVAAAGFVMIAYVRGWSWTGFTQLDRREHPEIVRPAKTLWDWLQLLLIPLALAAAAFVLNQLQSDREQRREDRRAIAESSRANKRTRDEVLRAYVQQMSQLMLDRKLLRSSNGSAVRIAARTVTLTAVRQLDGQRKGLVVQFLSEAGLLNVHDPKVDLSNADLRDVALEDAELSGVSLSRSNLAGANFKGAFLLGSRFIKANLRGADFAGARAGFVIRVRPKANERVAFSFARLNGARFDQGKFFNANFELADLRGASFRRAELGNADFSGGCLTRADFRNANLRFAELDALGREVDFSGADMLAAHGLSKRALFPAGWQRRGRTWRRASLDSRRCDLSPFFAGG
jgi:uncharacterized protein YjbI with pentapeptide repeats